MTNVQRLQRAWTYTVPSTPNSGIQAFENTPLMADDVVYFATETGMAIALNAETGKQVWLFNPFGTAGGYVRPVPNRGVAYWEATSSITCSGKHRGPDRRIFYTTPDARLFALDAATGKPCVGFGNGGAIDLRKGVAAKWPKAQYEVTSPPAIYKNLVIMGSEVQEWPAKGPSGAVRAFDARTGKLVWRFDTVPRPGQFGHNTWQDDEWKDRSGTNAWGPISIDGEHGLVFLPLGSPSYDFYGADRKGKALFGNSLVALRADTGKLVWYFQAVHHDLWDYDLEAQPVLVTLRRAGREIPAVVVVSKTGLVFAFNRLTGKPLFPIKERPVPQSHVPGEASSPTQPFPVELPPLARISITRADITTVTPESRQYCLKTFGSILPARIFDPPRSTLTLEIPGTLGGSNWYGASFDPSSGYLFVNVSNLGDVGKMEKQAPGAPEPYLWTSRWGTYARFVDDHHYPCQQPPWGTLNAVNLNTGRIAWKVPLGIVAALAAKGIPKTGLYNLGGSISTAGGLVFIGATPDNRFRAFDSRTGKQLWVTQLETKSQSSPMTYLGTKTKKQFVVIALGPGGRFQSFSPAAGSGPTVVAAYALFPKGQVSAAQSRLQAELKAESRTITAGAGALPPELKPPLRLPVQPIPFSHKQHMSIGLKCAQCHQFTEDGAQMQIPTVSTCMVCHQTILKSNPTIQKMARMQKEGQRIRWVRVYRLPNYVFFSHQKHVNAKISCAVCHGTVEDQSVMWQEKEVSMVSCVNCHKLYHASISCGVCHNIGR
ncbi:MAG: PQQ-binding-like beta-propeller repeat protein [Terriglobia bacterium]